MTRQDQCPKCFSKICPDSKMSITSLCNEFKLPVPDPFPPLVDVLPGPVVEMKKIETKKDDFIPCCPIRNGGPCVQENCAFYCSLPGIYGVSAPEDPACAFVSLAIAVVQLRLSLDKLRMDNEARSR